MAVFRLQVRTPLFGPIFALSKVPIPSAPALSSIERGKHLAVSRGMGMEQCNVPGMRFLYRPGLLIWPHMSSRVQLCCLSAAQPPLHATAPLALGGIGARLSIRVGEK